MGAAAKTEEMREATTDHIMDMIGNIEKIASSKHSLCFISWLGISGG
jgi:hypothetical protein